MLDFSFVIKGNTENQYVFAILALVLSLYGFPAFSAILFLDKIHGIILSIVISVLICISIILGGLEIYSEFYGFPVHFVDFYEYSIRLLVFLSLIATLFSSLNVLFLLFKNGSDIGCSLQTTFEKCTDELILNSVADNETEPDSIMEKSSFAVLLTEEAQITDIRDGPGNLFKPTHTSVRTNYEYSCEESAILVTKEISPIRRSLESPSISISPRVILDSPVLCLSPSDSYLQIEDCGGLKCLPNFEADEKVRTDDSSVKSAQYFRFCETNQDLPPVSGTPKINSSGIDCSHFGNMSPLHSHTKMTPKVSTPRRTHVKIIALLPSQVVSSSSKSPRIVTNKGANNPTSESKIIFNDNWASVLKEIQDISDSVSKSISCCENTNNGSSFNIEGERDIEEVMYVLEVTEKMNICFFDIL